MKKIAIILFFLSLPLLVRAEFLPDALSFTLGYWGDHTDRRGARIAGRWDWEVKWLPNSFIKLGGYWEGGFGYWHAQAQEPEQNTHLWITSASPMLQIGFGNLDADKNHAFLELGVGPAYLSQTTLGNKNFGCHWQFEDKMGAGFHLGTKHPIEFTFRYYHYSNASLIKPNNGLDLYTGSVTYFF